jgi:hypothetical protein
VVVLLRIISPQRHRVPRTLTEILNRPRVYRFTVVAFSVLLYFFIRSIALSASLKR